MTQEQIAECIRLAEEAKTWSRSEIAAAIGAAFLLVIMTWMLAAGP